MVIKCSAWKRKVEKQKAQGKVEILIGVFWFVDRDT
jgi:hypothetical protein